MLLCHIPTAILPSIYIAFLALLICDKLNCAALKIYSFVSIRYSQSLLELIDFLEKDPDDKDVLKK